MSSALQTELRQRKPFQSPAHEAVVGLLRTADLIRRHAAASSSRTASPSSSSTCSASCVAPATDGLPTLEVAERMIEQTPGVTRLLDRLEAKGLVRRQRCPKDRRQHLCWITAKGLALLEKIDTLARRAQPRNRSRDYVRRIASRSSGCWMRFAPRISSLFL